MKIYRIIESQVTLGHHWVDISVDEGINWKSQALFVGPGAEQNAKRYVEILDVSDHTKECADFNDEHYECIC